MIAVYCHEITPRIDYTFKLVLGELLGVPYTFHTELDSFMAAKGAKLCYAPSEIDGFWYQSGSLLFEDSIRDVKAVFEFENNHLLLDGNDQFDLFAATFYLVSRYEEYVPFQADEHNRFPATESILYEYRLLKIPVVNQWALQLKSELADRYPNLLFSPRTFNYISTLDIDQAFKYKHKGFKRNLGGFFRDLKNGEWSLCKERIRVLMSSKNDPYDNFDWQKKIHEQKNISSVHYFVQVGDHGEFDKNLSIEIPAFQKIIQKLDEHGQVGTHPSYASNTEPGKIAKEKKDLEKLLKREIKHSRQHYLMLRFPETYRRLCEMGIREEHSLGYSTHLGFRAGIAAPFLFFDLEKNESTSLRLVPFCMMDITPLHYNQQTVHEAKIELTMMINQIRKYGGLCVSLWHNESLSENGRWEGWRTVYEHVLDQVAKL